MNTRDISYKKKNRKRSSSRIGLRDHATGVVTELLPEADIATGVHGAVRLFSGSVKNAQGKDETIQLSVKSTLSQLKYQKGGKGVRIAAEQEKALMLLCYPEAKNSTALFHYNGGHYTNRLVMPFYGQQTLKSLFTTLDKKQQLMVLIDVLEELNRIHQLVIHGDVKEDNIMVWFDPVQNKYAVRFIDFGSAYRNAANAEVIYCRPEHGFYWAPERRVLIGKVVQRPCVPHVSQDTFSCGNMLIRLWVRWIEHTGNIAEKYNIYFSTTIKNLLNLAEDRYVPSRPQLFTIINEFKFQLFYLELLENLTDVKQVNAWLNKLETEYADRYLNTIHKLIDDGQFELAKTLIKRRSGSEVNWTCSLTNINILAYAIAKKNLNFDFVMDLIRHFDAINRIESLIAPWFSFADRESPGTRKLMPVLDLLRYISRLRHARPTFAAELNGSHTATLSTAIAIKNVILKGEEKTIPFDLIAPIAHDQQLGAIVTSLVESGLLEHKLTPVVVESWLKIMAMRVKHIPNQSIR